MGTPKPGVAIVAATPVAVLLVRGFAVRRWLGPVPEVLGAGVPGKEPGECLAGQGLSAHGVAFVVGGQVGNGVQPRPARAVAMMVQISAAIPAVPGFWEPPAFFLVTSGQRIVLSARLLSSPAIG